MSEIKIKKSIEDLQVGDKVWIRDDLKADKDYGEGELYFAEDMEFYCGKQITVREVNDDAFLSFHTICPIETDKDGYDNGWEFNDKMIDWDKTNGYGRREDGLQIEFDAEYDGGRKRGFEKVSQEQFEASLHGTTYEEEDSFLYDELKLPRRGTKHSAGYDIFSPFEFTLEPNETILIPTGIKAYMQFDEMVCGYPRSSKGFKFFMRLANTVAIGDSDYYDNIKNEGHYFIKIRNEGNKTMKIEKGEAFAQFIFQKYLLADDDNFEDGEDRVGGIGSTSENK